METEMLSEPVRVLRDYSQKRVGVNEVMRALASYKDWLVPVLLLAQSGETNLKVDRMVLLGTETKLPPGELWVFTDQAAAERAQAAGAMLGAYAANVAGTTLFAKFDLGFQLIRVNPYSADEQGWQFRPGSFELAKLWGSVIALEESFQNTTSLDVKSIARFEAFTLFNGPTGYVVTLPNQAGMTNPAAVFTAPDCADAFWELLSDEQRAGMKRIFVDGMTLIRQLPQQGIDGMYINMCGPGNATVLFFAEIEDINSLSDEN